MLPSTSGLDNGIASQRLEQSWKVARRAQHATLVHCFGNSVASTLSSCTFFPELPPNMGPFDPGKGGNRLLRWHHVLRFSHSHATSATKQATPSTVPEMRWESPVRGRRHRRLV